MAMAESLGSKSPTAKQLKEYLQEPFTLNIFLSERGYLVKCSSSNGRNDHCCQINLLKNLRRPCHQDELQAAGSGTNNFTEVKAPITPFGASPSCIVEEESLPSKYGQPGSSSRTSLVSNLGNVEQQKGTKTSTLACSQMITASSC
ncbi:hypothetical protein PTKIN_Ptkin10aG0119100 [Pterospermum kingtungense]